MFSSTRSICKTLVFAFIVGLGIFPTFAKAQTPTPSPVVLTPSERRLKEWAIPGAQSVRVCSSGMLIAGDFVSSKSFEDIWKFYTKKLKITGKYVGGESGTDGSDDTQRLHLNSSSDPSNGLISMRTDIRTSTLVLHTKNLMVVAFVSRGKTEKVTHLTLVIEQK